MNRHPTSPRTQPLTAEERALADRLARIGPHDGPSPALDAKILAAAHAAAATDANDAGVDARADRPVRARRRRWLGLTGVPAGLITGVGMAASLVLAIGVVWQLRPMPSLLPAQRETMADDGFVEVRAATSTKPAINAPAPPPAEFAEAAPAPASAQASPPSGVSRDAAFAGVASETEIATAKRAAESLSASPPAPSMATDSDVDAIADRESAELRQRAAEPPPAFVPSPPASAPSAPSQRRPSYTTSARATSEARAQESATHSVAAEQAAATAQVAGATSAARAESDNSTLDRIEVTGSRISRAEIPVDKDAQLEPVAWLQRIRERRDEGDLDGARESLALFRRSHPRLVLPDDLRTFESADRAR